MKKKLKKPYVWVPLLLLALFIGHFFFVSLYVAKSMTYDCKFKSIDLNSGKMRITEYSWYMKVSEKEENTLLSEWLEGERLGEEEDWEKVHVNTGPSRGLFVSYALDGSLVSLKTLELLFNDRITNYRYPDDLELKKQVCRQLLTLWKETRTHDLGDVYINNLSDKLRNDWNPSKEIDVIYSKLLKDHRLEQSESK